MVPAEPGVGLTPRETAVDDVVPQELVAFSQYKPATPEDASPIDNVLVFTPDQGKAGGTTVPDGDVPFQYH